MIKLWVRFERYLTAGAGAERDDSGKVKGEGQGGDGKEMMIGEGKGFLSFSVFSVVVFSCVWCDSWLDRRGLIAPRWGADAFTLFLPRAACLRPGL
jgi:hypothetical protein